LEAVPAFADDERKVVVLVADESECEQIAEKKILRLGKNRNEKLMKIVRESHNFRLTCDPNGCGAIGRSMCPVWDGIRGIIVLLGSLQKFHAN